MNWCLLSNGNDGAHGAIGASHNTATGRNTDPGLENTPYTNYDENNMTFPQIEPTGFTVVPVRLSENCGVVCFNLHADALFRAWNRGLCSAATD